MGPAWWLRSTLSVLLAFGILAVALPVAFGGGARGAGVEPIQVFSSGPLVAAASRGGAQLSASGMIPGQSRSATIHVANDGSAPAHFSLSPHITDRVAPGGTPLSGALVLRVEPAGSEVAPIYTGPLSAMPSLRLGSIPAGAQRAYRFTATLPAGVGNGVEGSSLNAAFTWNAA